MVYTGQPSKGCATCRKRRVKCDEQIPECGGCLRIKQQCPGYKNHFDLAWRDQTTVAKKGVERGKAKRKAARERAEEQARAQSPHIHAPIAQYAESSSSSSKSSSSPNLVFTPVSRGSQRSSASSFSESPPSDLTIQRPSSRHPLSSDPYLTILRPIPEEQALCFFFNHYVLPIRDPLARRGFLEHLGPFYTNADSQSPLKMSTMAIATCLMSTGMGRPPDSPLARSFYIRAVSQLSERVSKQKDCSGDELLVAVMLLQFYEASVGQLRKRTTNPHPHLDGALALIRHRGPQSFQDPVSRSILFYVRSLLIDEAFKDGSSVPSDVQEWEEVMPEYEKIPGIRLDSINLDLANLKAATVSLIQTPPSESRETQIQQLVKEATDIDRRLSQWPDSIPDTWLPIRVSTKEDLSPTLQLYQDYCDVYRTLFMCSLWNKLRISQILVRSVVLSLLDHQPPTFANNSRREGCQNGIQQLADDMCASVPYYLGDRMRPGRAGEPGINYPRVPGRPPIMDHYQTGPTMGGWSLLIPLGTLTRMKIRLREGQTQWLLGQMARTARIYNINMTKPTPPTPGKAG